MGMVIAGLALIGIGLLGWLLPYRWNILRLRRIVARFLPEKFKPLVPKMAGTILIGLGVFMSGFALFVLKPGAEGFPIHILNERDVTLVSCEFPEYDRTVTQLQPGVQNLIHVKAEDKKPIRFKYTFENEKEHEADSAPASIGPKSWGSLDIVFRQDGVLEIRNGVIE